MEDDEGKAEGMPEEILDTFEETVQKTSRQVDEITLALGMELIEKEGLNEQLHRIKERVKLRETIFEKLQKIEQKLENS